MKSNSDLEHKESFLEKICTWLNLPLGNCWGQLWFRLQSMASETNLNTHHKTNVPAFKAICIFRTSLHYKSMSIFAK